MNSNLGLGTLKSTAGYIGIRAQTRNPINRKLPRIVKQVAGASEERSGSLGFTFILFYFLFFSFLFFSFLFRFLFFFYVHRFIADYFLVLLLSVYFFWIWMLSLS